MGRIALETARQLKPGSHGCRPTQMPDIYIEKTLLMRGRPAVTQKVKYPFSRLVMQKTHRLSLFILPALFALFPLSCRDAWDHMMQMAAQRDMNRSEKSAPVANAPELPRPNTGRNEKEKTEVPTTTPSTTSGLDIPGMHVPKLTDIPTPRAGIVIPALLLSIPAVVVLTALLFVLGTRKRSTQALPTLGRLEEGSTGPKVSGVNDIVDPVDAPNVSFPWMLPGFFAVSVSRPDAHAGRFDFTDDRPTGIFDTRNFRFPGPVSPAGLVDIAGLSRILFGALQARFPGAEVTLFLNNSSGRGQAVYTTRGSILVEGPVSQDVPAGVHEKMSRGTCVVADEGQALYYPLDSAGGRIGIVRIHSAQSMYKPDPIRAAWSEINFFAETAYAGRVFDEAARDPETALWNGFLFIRDLGREFLRRDKGRPAGLLLLSFEYDAQLAEAGALGESFQAAFSPMDCYRIDAGLFAALGDGLREEELAVRLRQCLLPFQGTVRTSAGYASLLPADRSAEEWYERSMLALLESRRAGPNRYHMSYGSAA